MAPVVQYAAGVIAYKNGLIILSYYESSELLILIVLDVEIVISIHPPRVEWDIRDLGDPNFPEKKL